MAKVRFGKEFKRSSFVQLPASPRDEALFHCDEPSRVPRGPANSTASLTSQRLPGKFPQVFTNQEDGPQQKLNAVAP